MIEKIEHTDPTSILKKIKDSQLPTILYGASQAAELNYDYLVSQSIKIKDVVVDNKYLDKTKKNELRGHKIHSIESFIDSHNSPINLVIGFYSKNIEEIITKKLTSLTQQGLLVANVVLFDLHLLMYPDRAFTFQFIQDNLKEFEWVYNLWSDDRSREVMVAFVNQRISMQIGELEHIRDDNQYFLSSVVQLTDSETYVDCGAYDGDTIIDFLHALRDQTGKEGYRRIYALECNPASYPLLVKRVGHLPNVSCIDRGAWDGDATLSLDGDLERSSCLAENGGSSVHVSRLDDLLNPDDGCTFIKMDIEGAELPALRGAEATIRKHHPKLAICVYHKNDDLLTIPRYLHELNSQYRFFLRAHESKSGEVVLYAI